MTNPYPKYTRSQDRRWKTSERTIQRIKELREEGLGSKRIARKLGILLHIACYWINPEGTKTRWRRNHKGKKSTPHSKLHHRLCITRKKKVCMEAQHKGISNKTMKWIRKLETGIKRRTYA